MFQFNNVRRNFLLCCVLCMILSLTIGSAEVVKTKYGPVKSTVTTIGSIRINIFKNIPYAKPPIGDLRFELPQDADPWVDIKSHNAGISCPQISFEGETLKRSVTQEDCLHLDIYVKKDVETENLLPVLVYFHGGKFSSGSKNEYNPELLVGQHNIIVVIPNYRLGILGFLSFSDSEHSENLGLWDQRQALYWVQNNIEFFKGDKNKVTIAGHDAGGASVGIHILSPKSKGFFRAAISGSGTTLDPWVFGHSATAVHVATKVGCLQNASNSIIDCLKRNNLDNILQAQRDLKKIRFLPTIDTKAKFSFIPETPQKLYQLGYNKNVTYLAGVTKNEASVEVSKEFPKAVKHKHLDHIIQHLLEPYLEGSSDLHIIAKAANYHYLRGMMIPSFDSIQPQMENMMTDFLYNSPLLNTLNLHSLRNPDTFMYVFVFSRQRFPIGVSHMLDAYFIFNKTFGEWRPNSSTAQIRKILCDIWAHFIKTKSPGQPSIWKKFREVHHTNYIEISEILSHKTNYRKNAMEFWNLLVPDLKYYYNLSSELQTEMPLIENKDYTIWGMAGMIVILMVLCVAMVGTVTITRRRYEHSSIIPITFSRDDIKNQYEHQGF